MSATTTGIDPMALLAGMAQQTEKKKGKSAEKPAVNDASLDGSIGQWMEADKEVKKWEGIRTTAEAQILAFAAPARLAECRRMGKVESTIRLNGKVNMTQKCQYVPAATEHLPSLKAAFGADTDRYFKLRTKLELAEAATEDKEFLAGLIEALGPDRFTQAFKVKQYVEVTEAFHADFTLKPEVEDTARPFVENETIKAYKPSLRQ